eukprot:10883192-Alexandrium_andersonii.AAC.1
MAFLHDCATLFRRGDALTAHTRPGLSKDAWKSASGQPSTPLVDLTAHCLRELCSMLDTRVDRDSAHVTSGLQPCKSG